MYRRIAFQPPGWEMIPATIHENMFYNQGRQTTNMSGSSHSNRSIGEPDLTTGHAPGGNTDNIIK